MTDNRSLASRLITAIKSEGVSYAEQARELGVSERMLYAIRAGKSTGNRYEQALKELAYTGRVEHKPHRRRTKTGKIAKVRAPGGKTITPKDTGGRYTDRKQGGRYTDRTMHLNDSSNTRILEQHYPKDKKQKGEKAVTKQLPDSSGQKHEAKQKPHDA